ncbi:Sigma factor binding protein 2 [Heracleum sosnowskyi]|uniref:Sigma factor binding protein 2 n=1 Tax=Heracleum sosnowskyi TaxID=360622 RepID=A0AAD8MWT3_9APIA|nr:Sigma factor binding protein 2 [Heracleum sosnowskyi]
MNKQVVGVHDASKQIRKTKKKAEVKVVYISNPMKVNTSVSQFRALVQQLTGRNADDMPEEPFLEHSNVENEEQEQVVSEEVQKVDAQVAVSCVENEDNFNGSSDLLSLQDITGYFSPSNFWYESAFHVDGSKV